jgi:crotonobetainyl-CoA:carnitine CoA-transferase CaiB-like acyl-CoA transferase
METTDAPSLDAQQTGGRPPLAGTRVLELATYLSGPFATMMLADLGAEVVKVEPPRGDPFRRFGRPETYVSSLFANCNRAKRSVVLDLKTPDAVAKLLALAARSDILVCNWRPEVAERLGIGDEALVQANDQLIRIYISGYGPTGPLSEAPAFDGVLQALSGMTEAVSVSDQPAMLPGYPVDKLTAVMAVQAALAALISRARDGHGDRVDLPMLDTAAYLNFVDLVTGRTFIDHQPVEARNRQSSAVRPIEAAGGWLLVAPASADQVRRACRAVGHPEWGDELLAIPDSIAMVTAMCARLETVTRTAPVDQWLQAFQDHDVPVARCLGIDEHLLDPQVAHNQIYSVADWPDVGAVRTVRYPARFASSGPLPTGCPTPRLGADTDDIVAGLGDPEDTVAGLGDPEDTVASLNSEP